MTNGPNIISQFWKKCRAAGMHACSITQHIIHPGYVVFEAYIHDNRCDKSFYAYGKTRSEAVREAMRKAGL